MAGLLMLSSAIVAHLLIWRHGFAGIWLWPAATTGWLPEVVVRVWVAVLTLFQLLSLMLIIGALGLALGNGDEGWGPTFEPRYKLFPTGFASSLAANFFTNLL